MMILRLSADARWWKVLLLALVVVCFVWWCHPDDPLVVGSSADYDRKVEDLVAAEEWIELMGGVMNSRVTLIQSIPGDRQFGVVTFMNEFVGAGPKANAKVESTGLVISQVAEFSLPSHGRVGKDRRPWDLSLDKLVNVRNGRFGFLGGSFEDEARTSFKALVMFSAKGELEDGRAASFESLQEVCWKVIKGGATPSRENDYLVDPDEWGIVDWVVKEARVMNAGEQPLFVEVTNEVIPSEADRRLIESTKHAAFLEKLFSGGKIPLKSEYGRYFTTDATAQHPALSVVDLNKDGWDDLYVSVRWGRNLFFQNKGDGTFEEAAADYGLDFEGLSAAALFADFDNDGDQDLFLGRSLERSLYLRNDNGFLSIVRNRTSRFLFLI